jgi:hypothetical protein
MDGKALANMGVNSVSFSIKAFAWTYIIAIYDTNLEASMGEVAYEEKLWNDNGELFLWDYFASFMIKMTIFAFIFEMMNIRVVLQSDSPQ